MKVLINRSDAIGDVILTSSMAKMIKDKFPDAHVTFLISAKTKDLFLNHPYIDEVIIYHRNARFYKKIKEVLYVFKKVKPTHYFYVGGGYLPNFIAWLFSIFFRGGLKSRWHTYFTLNNGIRQKRSMVTMHEMEYNLNLLGPMGIEYNFQDKMKYTPEINLSQDEVQTAMRLFNTELEKNGYEVGRKMIFIHPGMSGHTLNWSSRNYGRLVLKFEQKFPNKFLFIFSHTPSDLHYLHAAKDILTKKEAGAVKNRVYFFDGSKSGLRNYMSVLSQAALFVGPSTGTTHIASVLGVPVISLYSPIKVQSALRWGPLTNSPLKLKVFVPDVICGEVRKCAERACPYYECMGKIEVEDVVKQAVSIMEL